MTQDNPRRRSAASFLIQFIFLLLGTTLASAQSSLLTGTITDGESKQPLSGVIISIPASGEGTATDEDGRFSLRVNKGNKVQISFIGYKKITKSFDLGTDAVFNISLAPDNRTLDEVIVKPKKEKYRNKNNPAVELIRKVIDNKSKNRLERNENIAYEQYEKLMVALCNKPEKLRKNIFFKKYQYIIDNIDTTTIEGKGLLPFYLQEKAANFYYQKNPEQKNTVVLADKKVDFGEFVDNGGLNALLKKLYTDINIYDNNIYLVSNQFLSPISNMAPTFYKYYITDTVLRDGVKCVELSFAPRNKQDFLFQGKLYVTLDGMYAVQQADMHINKDINLNWVRSMHIVMDYRKGADNYYELQQQMLETEYSLSQYSKGTLFGRRTATYKNYNYTQLPDSVFHLESAPLYDTSYAGVQAQQLLDERREGDLTVNESRIYTNIDKMKNSKSFKRRLDYLTLIAAGYKRASPYVEIGPVNTFYSFNPVEGFRLRFGGRTTPRFSNRLMLETYAAYGFKDEKWKYYLGGTLSLSDRNIWQFPVHSVRANFQRDMKIPGQELQFIQEDNFLLSFKRGNNDKWLYNDIYNVAYLHEYENHFSYEVAGKHWKQSPAGGLTYIQRETTQPETMKTLTTTEATLTLRYAPNEAFYQGKKYRAPIFNKYPIFTLRSTAGIKGVFGSQYNYQNFTLNIFKRMFMSQFGYSDLTVEAGIYTGNAPYPLLAIHRANQSYSMQLMSFNLMNFLEFVSDRYASVYWDHCFNGFFFNKIPLFKRLRFREHANFKLLYGGMRAENRPENNDELLAFPKDKYGNQTTFTLERQPYIEGSVGIGNIFNFLRIDYIKRFTYLDNPNIAKSGIRFRAKFDF